MKRLVWAWLFCGCVAALSAQTDNTIAVKQFPGKDVGTKVTNAMATCNTSASIPCILVIDPSLAGWPAGTMPSLCSHCFLQDFRTGPPSASGYPGVTSDGANGLHALGKLIGSGVIDLNRGVPIMASGLPIFAGFGDPCNRIAGGIDGDWSAGILGSVYGEDVAPGLSPIHCGPNAYFPPDLFSPGPGLQNGTGGTVYPAPGVLHFLQKELDVPWGWNFECPEKWGGSSVGTSCLYEPDTTFAGNAPGTLTALLNLGCPLGSAGACFSAGSAARYINLNGLGNPFLACIANFSTQQGGGIYGNSTEGCVAGGIVLNSQGTSGGSQNQENIDANIMSYAQPSANIIMTSADVTVAGTYSTPPIVTVSGCTTPPTYAAALVAGGVGYLYPVGQSPGGNCPNPAAVTISFTPAGATAFPVLANQAPKAPLQALAAAGAAMFTSNSMVAQLNPIPMPYGAEVENSANTFINNYVESAQLFGFGVDLTTSAGTFANSFIGTKCAGANAALFACIGIVPTSRVNSFLMAGTQCGTGTCLLLGSVGGNPAFNISSLPQAMGAGNEGVLGLVVQTPNGTTLSTEREAVTTVNTGQQFYNCGAVACNSTTLPHQFTPVWMVNGALQSGISTSVGLPVGIANNGIFSTDYTKKVAAAMNNSIEPVILDTTTYTVGDCVVLSTTILTPIEGHDAGSAVCPPGVIHLGWLVDDKTGAPSPAQVPSTPSAPALSVHGSAGTRTVGYKVVVNDFAADGTVSIPSTAATLSTAPNGLGDGNGVNFTGLPSGLETLIYRTASGDATLPAGTFVIDASGQAQYITIGTATGPDALFPPTLVFSGGGCTVEPTGTAIVVAGLWSGVAFTTRGSGCTGNGTITATASPYETGLVHRSNGSTTWSDMNAPGDGSTPLAAGQLAPDVFLNIGWGASPTFGAATLVSGTATVSNGAACTPGAACVYSLQNCGKNASSAIGTLSLGTVTVGTSFVINSETAAAAVASGDASTVCWRIN